MKSISVRFRPVTILHKKHFFAISMYGEVLRVTFQSKIGPLLVGKQFAHKDLYNIISIATISNGNQHQPTQMIKQCYTILKITIPRFYWWHNITQWTAVSSENSGPCLEYIISVKNKTCTIWLSMEIMFAYMHSHFRFPLVSYACKEPPGIKGLNQPIMAWETQCLWSKVLLGIKGLNHPD